ncbi:nucleoside triphosphate pyrophosphohydrolase, partial [Ectopseudomonas mendocina]
SRPRANADQISLPKRSFVGAPPRGEAFQSRIALVRGGAPLLPIGSVDA